MIHEKSLDICQCLHFSYVLTLGETLTKTQLSFSVFVKILVVLLPYTRQQ